MNPITRMMKRYIKTPLKYALPLLFVGALVLVSISGCTTTNNTPTATPTGAPSATAATNTATFDPALKKLETALKSEYPGVGITEYAADANHTADYLGISYTLPNGNTLTGTADNGTVSYQTGRYQTLEKPITDETLDQANATAFGQSAVASVLGGGVTTQDTNLQTPGTPYFSDEYILYTGSAAQNAIFMSFVQSGTST
jgi:hypothetical protein